MNSPIQERVCGLFDADLTAKMHIGLFQLLKAHQAAKLAKRDKWDFAVEIQILREFGLDHSDLRSLLCRGLVEHGLEKSCPAAHGRTFRMKSGLSLRANSCFVLSESGLEVVKQSLIPGTGWQHSPFQAPHFLPVWDGHRRELNWGSLVVKRFRQPARNQEAILAAFQEEGWPSRIDDPLSGKRGWDAQERLRGAVKKLNRQQTRLLRFLSDGAGQGVLWEAWACEPAAAPERPLTPR